jgi:hypothetical protein
MLVSMTNEDVLLEALINDGSMCDNASFNEFLSVIKFNIQLIVFNTILVDICLGMVSSVIAVRIIYLHIASFWGHASLVTE